MKQFNLHRFGLVVKADLSQNRKFYLSMLLGGFIAFVCSQLGPVFPYLKLGGSLPFEMKDHADKLFFTFMIVYFLFTTNAFASLFRCLSTKEERINFLMLPATNLEKYLARFLTICIGSVIAGLLLFGLADLVRIGLFAMLSLPTDSVIPYAWDQLTNFFTVWNDTQAMGGRDFWQRSAMVWNVLLSLTALYSVFLTGSAIFRRHPYVYTWACIFLYGMITTTLIINGRYLSMGFPTTGYSTAMDITVSALMTVGFVLLSYVLFTRTTLIRRKFSLRFKR